MGGAYIYIDPTPSKKVSKANINVDHVSCCAIPAMGCAPCLAGGGPWDARCLAGPWAGHGMNAALPYSWVRDAWGQLAHAWGIMPVPCLCPVLCPMPSRSVAQ